MDESGVDTQLSGGLTTLKSESGFQYMIDAHERGKNGGIGQLTETIAL